ncbi:hypothetical protein Y1Q_0014122 [Alligator mississippiensis]|uniref:Uncharacterized protein n=1 Tax=Alligator mississippiensis TaxID=8496 RepID=A0A151NLK0_ALLMI|nr:hypothetical protein Y1Q_0014122 [Alligator mississippiensis]
MQSGALFRKAEIQGAEEDPLQGMALSPTRLPVSTKCPPGSQRDSLQQPLLYQTSENSPSRAHDSKSPVQRAPVFEAPFLLLPGLQSRGSRARTRTREGREEQGKSSRTLPCPSSCSVLRPGGALGKGQGGIQHFKMWHPQGQPSLKKASIGNLWAASTTAQSCRPSPLPLRDLFPV